MNWENFIPQFMVEIVAQTGIVIGVLKFFGNKFAEILSKKYEIRYSNTIENKSYVSKAKFDANFAICQEISEKFISCFEAVYTITPKDGYGIDNAMEIDEISIIINNFKNSLNKNMPILPAELYDQLCNVINDFNIQVAAYQAMLGDTENIEIDSLSQNELELKKKAIYDLLRDYYNHLEVTSN